MRSPGIVFHGARTQWGENGADIICGEGQPLGVPLASGGPYFGFMCCKQVWVRQMPGRIVGRSTDVDGKSGFCLTLQAREQHIRRSKATSNICTNQGLMVTAATIYMSILGFSGLQQVATDSHQNAVAISKSLSEVKGVKLLSRKSFFHEFVLQLPCDPELVLARLSAKNIQAGFNLSPYFPAYHNSLLICSTEVHSPQDHKIFAKELAAAIEDVTAPNKAIDGSQQSEISGLKSKHEDDAACILEEQSC